MNKIPVFEPELGDADRNSLARAVDERSISGTSPIVHEFERAVATRVGMPHAVAVSNGTAALELAVAALGLGPGDEILCPALTIISCARAIVLAGATPVLVDVLPGTYCIDPDHAARRITEKTRAILGVHAFGHPFDATKIGALAAKHELLVVEDAAQAHGAVVRDGETSRECGCLGDVATFSFYANKAVTTGEGGMVLARRAEVALRARNLSNLFLQGPRRFFHEELGHNYRFSGVQAALGLSQLARLDETLLRKRRIAAHYRRLLAEVPEVELQAVEPWAEPTFWMNPVVVSEAMPFDATELAAALDRRGIETRPFFVGLHEQPALLGRGLFGGERYPVTERLSTRGLYLPSGTGLADETIDHVVRELRGAIAELRPLSRSVPAESDTRHEASTTPFGPAFAEAYDALYAEKDDAAEVDVVEHCFRRFRREPTRRVLDLGCGTGRHAAELVRRGYSVVGVDQSKDMLARARARVPEATFHEGRFGTARLGETFDAVVILFAALSYETTALGIRDALRTVRSHLVPGGLFVADVWFGAAPAAGTGRTRRSATRGAVTWVRTGTLRRDPLAQRVDLLYELTRTEGGETVTSREMHAMHYFTPFELEFALEASGLSLLHLSREEDLERPPRPGDLTALFVAVAR